MISKARGESRRHRVLMKPDAVMNRIAFVIEKASAAFPLIFPLGISRSEVLGFILSINRSAQRLNPIAAFRAVTIQAMHSRRIGKLNGCPVNRIARKNPIIAKGIAKMVWLKTTREK